MSQRAYKRKSVVNPSDNNNNHSPSPKIFSPKNFLPNSQKSDFGDGWIDVKDIKNPERLFNGFFGIKRIDERDH